MLSRYNTAKSNYLKIDYQSGGGYNRKNKRRKNKSNNRPTNNMRMHLSEPWFTLISMGMKTVEGRKNKGVFKDMKIGDVITWYNDDFKSREIKTKVTGKRIYMTFQEYLETEGLEKCLPGVPSIDHGLIVYFKYFTKEDEQRYGVVAIELELV